MVVIGIGLECHEVACLYASYFACVCCYCRPPMSLMEADAYSYHTER